MAGNRIDPVIIIEPLRTILDRAREVAASGDKADWDALDVAVVDLVAQLRSRAIPSATLQPRLNAL